MIEDMKGDGMIEVVSYLRRADGGFVPLEDATEPPPDARYVEGAIKLSIDGKDVIDANMWDYVDQLWSYIADMVYMLHERNEVETFFPDQPIRLIFTRKSSDLLLVSLIMNGESRRVLVNEGNLLEIFREYGSRFFERLSELLPQNKFSYDQAKERLNQVAT